ncbi:DUF1707 domain-containing protein [Streptomyces sp. NPDC002851]
MKGEQEGRQDGRQDGRQEGRQDGRQDGEQAVRSVAVALAAGTLSIEQADARIAAVYAARTPQERARLTADLAPPTAGHGPHPRGGCCPLLLPQIAAVTGVSLALLLLWAALPETWFWPVVPIVAMVAAVVVHARRCPFNSANTATANSAPAYVRQKESEG